MAGTGPSHGNVKNLALRIDGLDFVSTGNPEIVLTQVMPNRSVTFHNFFGSGSTVQRSIVINESATLDVGVFLDSSNTQVQRQLLETVEGNRKPSIYNPDGLTLDSPSATNPLFEMFLAVGAWQGGDGGEVGTAREVTSNIEVDGPITVLTAPLDAPTNPVADNPTSTTIDVTWDASAITLGAFPSLLQIKEYDIYQSLAPGGPYTKVVDPGLPLANTGTGTLTHTVTGLTASTAYYFVVRGRDQFSLETPNSAEVSETTTA